MTTTMMTMMTLTGGSQHTGATQSSNICFRAVSHSHDHDDNHDDNDDHHDDNDYEDDHYVNDHDHGEVSNDNHDDHDKKTYTFNNT